MVLRGAGDWGGTGAGGVTWKDREVSAALSSCVLSERALSLVAVLTPPPPPMRAASAAASWAENTGPAPSHSR
eukprot:COSAG01_NODE_20869_length_930_cov_8.239471_1_plen_73_part_00